MVRLLDDKQEVLDFPRLNSTMELDAGKFLPDQLVRVRLYFDDPNPTQVMTASQAADYMRRPVAERYSPGMVEHFEEDHCGGFC